MSTQSPNEAWIPQGVPLDKPSPARMYDYYLGGHHNFEVDRQAAEQVLKIMPEARLMAQANRAFLIQAVKYLAEEEGVDQFLDIGSGIPTKGNVHEVAQGVNPEAKVVYVDIDPIAVAHSRAILEGNPNAICIQADARDPEQIVSHPEVRELLDFSRPVALLLVALLHFITDDEEAYGIVRRFGKVLAPGSFLVISHLTYEGWPEDVLNRIIALYKRSTAPGKARSYAEIQRFFEGWELVEPGLVALNQWRPMLDFDYGDMPAAYAGVARKP
ncbi:MAG: SAM-dependent methyltransferase [Ardenticatenia bacterium]|nr:SAM-dependent methyltransferase [Ardenticatenia bacterium]